MQDWTYRDALNHRLAELYAAPSREDAERAWGEGETERMAQWHERHPGGLAELMLRVQEFGHALATALQPMVQAIADVADALGLRDTSPEEPVSIRRRHPASRLRNVPGHQMRPDLRDQRVAIARQYQHRRIR